MTLGDNVTIETYGLSGHITGSIAERTMPGEPSRATGELQVKDGQYTALARKLDIERGRLIFNGGLLADPAVDIRAVKVVPGREGRRQRARHHCASRASAFFSEPSMPQSQIVSLLLAGGSLNPCRIRIASVRRRAAGSRRTGRGAARRAARQQARHPRHQRGVHASNETSLVLGKYLSPRLYVSYGVSLTESINTIKMRYTINDHWTIKTEAGSKERAGDLVLHHREMKTQDLPFAAAARETTHARRRNHLAARVCRNRAADAADRRDRTAARFRHLVTPGGQTMSVAMTNCGPWAGSAIAAAIATVPGIR